MRKHQQKKILGLILTLNEAHAELKRLLARRDIAAAVKLLAQCQDFVIQIGSHIEGIAGEGTHTVALLEQCHEALYLAAEQINGKDRESAAGRIRHLLNAVEESVRRELAPDKIEVVFLPYKAAMWDSLESIWLAARDDPGCDAHVIPIPYFDRLPNGGLGQMHYEGDQYPDYVPITDWQTYDIEANHPDIIFIHSPYDDGNTITSIHPFFYSKRLKDFTDLLAYVPYFVCVDDVPEHFCVCTGTMYAGKVYVQSEKIRQTYIREFKKFEDQYQCHNRFGRPEDKFVAIGSPKFDKVIHSGPEDFTLPDQWRRLITKPDGAKKKVVLYNTTIEAVLRESEKCLDKMDYVLAVLRERDDVVLWWRPHPLNETVYRSMQPQLLERYLQIVADYKQGGYGIFDDTPDLNRALCLTDCYYGDWSSLVTLYQCTGKPVMIQNAQMTEAAEENRKEFTLAFEKLYDDGAFFWFSPMEYNALFRLDKQTLKPEYMGTFPDEAPYGCRLYYSITMCEGALCLAPLLAKELATYDTKKHTFSKVRVVEEKRLDEYLSIQKVLTFAIVPYKQYLFLAGKYPAIIRCNMQTGQIDYFDDWLAQVKALSSGEDLAFFKAWIVGRDPKLLILPCLNINAAVVFDMEACISRLVVFGHEKEGFDCACFDGHDFWFAKLRSPSLLRWNLETGAYKEIIDFPSQFAGANAPFHNFTEAIYGGGYIWLIPSKANMALRIDPGSEEICAAQALMGECGRRGAEGDLADVNYTCAYGDDQYLYAFAGKSRQMIRYAYASQSGTETAIALPDEISASLQTGWMEHKVLQSVRIVYDRLNACQLPHDSNYYEHSQCTLNDLLTFLTRFADAPEAKRIAAMQTDFFQKNIPNSGGTSGLAIFRYCRQLMDEREGGQ